MDLETVCAYKILYATNQVRGQVVSGVVVVNRLTTRASFNFFRY